MSCTPFDEVPADRLVLGLTLGEHIEYGVPRGRPERGALVDARVLLCDEGTCTLEPPHINALDGKGELQLCATSNTCDVTKCAERLWWWWSVR